MIIDPKNLLTLDPEVKKYLDRAQLHINIGNYDLADAALAMAEAVDLREGNRLMGIVRKSKERRGVKSNE